MRDRLFSSFECKFADNDNTGTFEGYAATFGNVDHGGDVIVKGAFKRSLKEWKGRGKLPKMLVQHGGWGMSDRDGLPVGKWESMSEDESGLYVKGRLINLDTDLGKRLYGCLREGEIDKMSIGYRARTYTLGTTSEEPRRTLKEIDLFEVSLVTFPMNDEASITSVKSFAEISIRDVERALVSGMLPPLSEDEAKALLAGGFKSLCQERDARAEDVDELKALILRNINSVS